MAQVSLKKLVKSYDSVLQAVKGIDLEVADEEFVVLVGPSGCGKTTTLRMVAGLEPITSGEISIGGRVVNEVPPRDRDIAMVFQNYALYPHMSVFENIAFGLRMRHVAEADIRTRVAEAARILDIATLLERKPRALSGGQRQRVAMGRAIVRHPKLFLFDEPLSNLDAKLRAQMRTEIKKVHQTVRTTTLYVTHDQVEAMTLADRVVVMNQGRIEQLGTPADVYHRPATRFVAGFIGSPAMNFFPALVAGGGDGPFLELAGDIRLPVPPERAEGLAPWRGKRLELGLRPEHITGPHEPEPPGVARFPAEIDVTEPMGMETLVHFRVGDVLACGRLDPRLPVAAGQRMALAADLRNMHLIDPQSGRVI
ncbi:MAG: ABC transporter ATP-binding protein [Acetobacteraceae bacterium]